MSSTQHDSPAMDDVIHVYCGNPWRANAAERHEAIDRSGFAPSADRGPEAWLQWWDLLPEGLRTREAAIAACVGLSRAAADPWPAMTELARRFPKPVRSDAPALAGRALTLERGLAPLVGASEPLRLALEAVWHACFGPSLAATDTIADALRETPVWIHGETGTGRHLVAEAVAASCQGRLKRSQAEWRPGEVARVDASTLDEAEQVEALLANIVDDDTLPDALLVTDATELAPRAQAALARRVEGPESRDPNAPRLVVTARCSPAVAAAEGVPAALLRPLSSITIELPPLRMRRDDVFSIAMTELSALGLGDDVGARSRVDAFLIGAAARHPWPGNLRELRAVVREVVLGIAPRLDARNELRAPPSTRAPAAVVSGAWTMNEARSWYARHVRAMSASDVEAAKRLDINRGTLARILRESRD